MNLHTLLTMLDYHYWARDRMLDALDELTPEQFNRDLGSSFKSIRETVVHLYAAEVLWHARWSGQPAATLKTMDAFPDPGSVRRAWIDRPRRSMRNVPTCCEQPSGRTSARS